MINKIYNYLGIRKVVTFEFNINKLDFYRIFSSNIYNSSVYIQHPFENMMDKNNRYVGESKFDSFVIRKKSSISTNDSNSPYVIGEIEEIQKDRIKVQAEINGGKHSFIFILMIYFITIIWVITYRTQFLNSEYTFIPSLVILFFTILFISHIIRTRYIVQQEVLDIERELNFFVSKANSLNNKT